MPNTERFSTFVLLGVGILQLFVQKKSLTAVLWIRTQIWSVFINLMDPDPYSETDPHFENGSVFRKRIPDPYSENGVFRKRIRIPKTDPYSEKESVFRKRIRIPKTDPYSENGSVFRKQIRIPKTDPYSTPVQIHRIKTKTQHPETQRTTNLFRCPYFLTVEREMFFKENVFHLNYF